MWVCKESIHYDADPAIVPQDLAEYNAIYIADMIDQSDENIFSVVSHSANDAKPKD